MSDSHLLLCPACYRNEIKVWATSGYGATRSDPGVPAHIYDKEECPCPEREAMDPKDYDEKLFFQLIDSQQPEYD